LIGKLPVSQSNLNIIRRGLWKVVNGENGTARGSRLVDIDMSGKTGTSQVISRKEDESLPEEDMPVHLRSHAWFVAYAPSDEPRIAVAVVVEHGEHGSGTAAPIAREMIKTYLRQPAVNTQLATQNEMHGTGGGG
jgi:penicillin-binding protein 2